MNGKKKISLLCMGLLALTSACEKTGDSKNSVANGQYCSARNVIVSRRRHCI